MRIVFALVLLVVQINVFAQTDSISLNSILEKTVKVSNDQPVEKVYLHFDKPYYAVGDTIWFKAYLTMDQHVPSNLSKIVYVDIIANQDSIVDTYKFPVTNSTASGNIILAPLSYKQGNYRIRAYTNWMFNFKDDYFFYKNILIGDEINKELITHFSLSRNKDDKGSKASVNLVYKDESGKAYSNKKLNWRVMNGYETVAKGKGQTDASGAVIISIPDSKKLELNKALLITTIESGSLKVISNKFPLAKAAEEKDVQFFPEGGELISGLPSKVAFKAIRTDGSGLDINGTVVDNDGKEVSALKSEHLGMGAFILLPEEGKSYKANIVFPDGSRNTYTLPVIQKEGINLRFTSADTARLTWKIMANTPFFEKNKNKVFYLIARSGGVVCYAAQMRLQGQVVSVPIEKDKLPHGIVELTLLAANGEPLSARLSFVHRTDGPAVVLKSDRPSYTTRQKVKLSLSPLVPAQPFEGNLSVAVIDETKVPFDNDAEVTILSSLLLSSELKGYIEKPNYYFTGINDKKLADLDLLLMTQGYRSFSYQDILTNKYPSVVFPPEQGITISGTLRLNNGMPVSKGNVRLIIPDKSFGASVVTDTEGRFVFNNVVFTDSSKVTLSAVNNVNSKNMVFTLDGMAFPSLSGNINTADEVVNIDSTLSLYLQNSKKQYFSSRMLQEVVVKAKVIEKKSSHADYPALAGLSSISGREISADRFKGCTNFLQCLQGAAMGLTFVDNEFYISRDYMSGNRTPVQIFVRDMPVDVNYLNTVNPMDVESVEIFLKDDLSGINRRYNTNGVLVVNTKQIKKQSISAAQLRDLFPPANILTFSPKGYSKIKQFYVPKYAGPASSLSTSDLRTTVYWNPNIQTDKTGNASFEFFNSDGKGTYKAVVEGIDKDGKLGRYIYRYTVK